MTGAAAVTVAVTFVRLGMVLAISFLETPLTFRAPEVTARLVQLVAVLFTVALPEASGGTA